MDAYLSKILKMTITLLFFVLFFYVAIIAKQFFYPIALAMLLSYLIFPITSFFENKLKFKRIFAILVSILVGLFIMFLIGNLVLIQIKVFIKDFPEIKQQAIDNLNFVQGVIEKNLGYSIADQQDMFNTQVTDFLDSSNKFFSNILKTATGTLTKLIFIPIFTFFMLFYRDRVKNFVLQIASRSDGDTRLTEGLLEQISKVTIKYMSGVLTVVAILAITHSVALSIIGVKYAIFLGIMAASISVIPYFGTIASSVIPLTFSLILTKNPYEPMWIMIYFIFINAIENNLLTPMITGGNVSLNPLITILSLIVGAMVWGIPGMLVAIPIIGVIKIVCDNINGLEPYGYILGVEKNPHKYKKLREKLKKKQENK